MAVVEVTDGLGRTVSSQTVTLAGQESTAIRLDLSQQPSGTYYYRLRYNSEVGRTERSGMLQLVR